MMLMFIALLQQGVQYARAPVKPVRLKLVRSKHIRLKSDSPLLSLSQAGFSLLELLVSLLVFSVGMLGLMSVQLSALRLSHDSSLNYRASLLASERAEQMLATGSMLGLQQWQEDVARMLPAGTGTVTQSADAYQIVLQWRSSEAQSNAQTANASTLQSYRLDITL
jgi:type IV pilus assembly protein PilV